MTRKGRICLVVWLLATCWALCQSPHKAQTAPKPEEPATTVRGKSTTVLVDVVVRDRKGRPVSGLDAEDFEVREEGVAQAITFFQTPEEVARRREQPDSQQARKLLPRSLRNRVPAQSLDQTILSPQGSFTALVFSDLRPENRVYVRKAAIEYASKRRDGVWMGVYQSGRYLQAVQFFTRDSEAVETAIERATGESLMHHEPAQEEMLLIADRVAEILGGGNSVSQGSPGLTSASERTDTSLGAGGSANLRMLLMRYHILDMSERMQRQVAGHAQTDALLALINTVRTLPGRKSMIYFSEGIEIPHGVEGTFRTVIHAANRAQVSIYTVDAAGLRINSTGRETSREISRAEVSRRLGSQTGLPMSGPMTRDILEKREDLIRSDAHKGLLQLAKDTGGIFIRDTNDLSAGLRRIDEDQHSYYLLAYSPTNAALDGTFRTIDVQVDVPDADIQFRRGYYAVDTLFDEEPVLEYELPALAMLAKATATEPIPVASTVLSFPNPKEPGLVTILAAIPPGVLRYKDDGDMATSNFAFVALVRDEDGNLVRKVSQQYRLGHAKDAPAPGDSILFYREVRLDPGRYAVEVAGFDAIAGTGGISRSEITLLEPNPSLPEVSSVVLVDRAEKMTGDRSVPLRAGDVLLYPVMSDRIRKSEHPRLDFFFSLYSTGEVPHKAIIEVLHYSTTLVRTPVDLSAPDSDGRITYQGTLPLSNLPNGIYTLRILVPTGDQAVARSRRFIVED